MITDILDTIAMIEESDDVMQLALDVEDGNIDPKNKKILKLLKKYNIEEKDINNELNLVFCNFCNKYHPNTFVKEVFNYDQIEYVCKDCLKELYVKCDDCGSYELKTRVSKLNNKLICYTCKIEKYGQCEKCGNAIILENKNIFKDKHYCEECHNKMVKYWKPLHSYDYKPDNFYKTKTDSDNEEIPMYMGIEIEFNNLRRTEDVCTNNLMYFKKDGTLDSGMECVSHPCTLNYHKNKMEWNKTLRSIIRAGGRSHNDGNCGLHVHINRDYFTAEEIERIQLFVELNRQSFIKISRRRNWERMCCAKSREDVNVSQIKEDIKYRDDERYVAINNTNRNTVEFRFFRGTLKYPSFMSSLNIIDSLIRYIKKTNENELSFSAFLNYSIEKYPELKKYYTERGL